MAQDSALTVKFSLANTQTLGALNANSALMAAQPPPHPSAQKRQSVAPGSHHWRAPSASRQSLVPRPQASGMFGRASVGPNMLLQTPVHGAGSSSTMQLKNFNTAVHTRNADFDRRSSVAYRPRPSTPAGPSGPMAVKYQSFFQPAPAGAGITRDPRPLKDRSFQARIAQELLEFLAQGNFEMEMNYSLSPNFAKSPTQRDFNFLFQWLYKKIDPTHKFQKNIDQEVPPLLRQIRYPFERSITKSQLAAVGGQNWPLFLGLLHWMMKLVQMLEAYCSNRYDYATAEAGTDLTSYRIIYNFLIDAYPVWLSTDEEMGEEETNQALVPYVEEMRLAFEKHNAHYIEEAERLEAENKALKADIEELEKETPDPRVLDEYLAIMEEDKVKFEEYIALASGRIDKYEAKIRILQEEHDKLTSEADEAEAERRELQQAVDRIGIAMQDIDRMNADQERLQRSLEAATTRLDETKKRVSEKEAEASQRLDDLERAVDRYNNLAYQIALIPATAANAKGCNFELALTLGGNNSKDKHLSTSTGVIADPPERLLVDAVTGYQAGHIVNLDLRGNVKSSFAALRKEVSDRRSVAIETLMKDHDMLVSAKEKIEEHANDVEALTHRLHAAEDEYKKTKEETQTQRMKSEALIENAEKTLAKMKSGFVETVGLMEQRELSVNLEYDQLKQRAISLREELHAETERILNDVIKFKMHIQRSLDEYQSFVQEEVEQELAETEELYGDGNVAEEEAEYEGDEAEDPGRAGSGGLGLNMEG